MKHCTALPLDYSLFLDKSDKYQIRITSHYTSHSYQVTDTTGYSVEIAPYMQALDDFYNLTLLHVETPDETRRDLE